MVLSEAVGQQIWNRPAVVAARMGHRESRTFAIESERRIVATGGLLRLGDVWYLGTAATLPEYQGRGFQSALIARRMAVAAEMGLRGVCAVVFADGASCRNLVKMGLEVLYERSTYVRRATT